MKVVEEDVLGNIGTFEHSPSMPSMPKGNIIRGCGHKLVSNVLSFLFPHFGKTEGGEIESIGVILVVCVRCTRRSNADRTSRYKGAVGERHLC